VQRAATPPFLQVSGRFYRAVRPERLAHVLDPPAPLSAGRYHRPGQAALYITREADWAVIAVARYMAEEGSSRMIVPLRVSTAAVLDQRDAHACAVLGVDPAASACRWQVALAEQREPESWHNADAARAVGADGLTDPSRGIVDGWHLTLFRWNEPGAPTVEVDGDPLHIDYAAARSRWPAPDGWMQARGDMLF
jgi:RES domain-containing protein